MSSIDDYTKQEWRNIIILASHGISELRLKKKRLSASMLVGIVKELAAFSGFFAKAKAKYPNNELVKDVAECLKDGNKCKETYFLPETYPQVEDIAAKVNSILAKKSDKVEASEFRAFVYEMTFELCNASGDGFLGAGAKINASEAELLHRLKSSMLGEDI